MPEPSQARATEREIALRELISSFEERSSSATVDLFEQARKDVSGTKKLLYGGGFSLAGVLSVVGGWTMDFLEKQEKQADDIAAIAKRFDALETRLRLLGGQQGQLANRIVGAELLVLDGTSWLGDRLDVCRRAKAIKKPDSLEAARRRIQEMSYDRVFQSPQ